MLLTFSDLLTSPQQVYVDFCHVDVDFKTTWSRVALILVLIGPLSHENQLDLNTVSTDRVHVHGHKSVSLRGHIHRTKYSRVCGSLKLANSCFPCWGVGNRIRSFHSLGFRLFSLFIIYFISMLMKTRWVYKDASTENTLKGCEEINLDYKLKLVIA